MTTLPVASIIATLLAILMFPLTSLVSMRRAAIGEAEGELTAAVFGDHDDETLRRRSRAFGNFIEYVPMCLIMLALLELSGGSALLVWSIGGLLVVGRVLHALGMLYANSPIPRGLAMFMTYATFLLPAGWLLLNFWRQ